LKSIIQPANKAFALLVFTLIFLSAWKFWTSLMDGQVMDSDLIAPIAYGFAALSGTITLLVLSRLSQCTGIERGVFILSAVVLVMAPITFFFLSGLLLQTIVQIKYWVICLAILGGMVFLGLDKRLTHLQKTGTSFSLLMGIITPIMPWAGTAWLMIQEQLQEMQRKIVISLLLGLALFLLGIFNPVQFSSQTYEQSAYIGGTLVSRGFFDIANLNFSQLAGMELIMMFSALLITLRAKNQKNNYLCIYIFQTY
jgi:hypothetical protein